MRLGLHIMPKAKIDREYCKGCDLCITVCPQKLLTASGTLNGKGYFTAELLEPDKCNGCGICYTVCAEVAIEIVEDDE